MKRFFELLIAVTVALGVFYTLAVHAIWFPIFKGTYVKAQNIASGDTDNLVIFAGTNFTNLAIALSIAVVSGVLIIYIGKGITWFVHWFFAPGKLVSEITTQEG